MQKITSAILAVLLFVFSVHTNGQVRTFSGCLVPAHSGIRAKGQIDVGIANGIHQIYFSQDYQMSSGVVLDAQVCGKLSVGGSSFCLSVGEIRKLRGPYSLQIQRSLMIYEEVRIFDIDLVRSHASAKLTSIYKTFLNCR